MAKSFKWGGSGDAPESPRVPFTRGGDWDPRESQDYEQRPQPVVSKAEKSKESQLVWPDNEKGTRASVVNPRIKVNPDAQTMSFPEPPKDRDEQQTTTKNRRKS